MKYARAEGKIGYCKEQLRLSKEYYKNRIEILENWNYPHCFNSSGYSNVIIRGMMVFVQWRRMRMCKQYEKLLLIKLNKYDLL
jgi:hypothetical protein